MNAPSSTRLLCAMRMGLFFISCAAYANTLQNAFVWDDMMQVLQNPWITDVKFLPEIFSNSVWGFHGGAHSASNYYRPLMNVFFMATYYAFGLTPWGFHLVNVLLHAATTLTLFVFVATAFPSIAATPPLFVPFTAALLFALHPIHTEAVAWVCGITDVSYTLFVLLSVQWYLVFRTTVRTSAYGLSLSFFCLALLCKEPAAILPVILVVCDRVVGPTGERLSSRLRRLLPYCLVVGMYLILRFRVLGAFAPLRAHRAVDLLSGVLTACSVFVQSLGKLAVPVSLNALHESGPGVSTVDFMAIAAVTVTLGYVGVCAMTYKRHAKVCLALTLVAAPLVPALYLSVLGEDALAERYLYLPSTGFVVLLAMLFARVSATGRAGARAVAVVLVCLAGFYAMQAIARNRVWKSNVTLYGDMVRNAPESETARDNLANALMAEGQVDEAIGLYQSIVRDINPRSAKSYYNLGLALEKTQRLGEAARAYEESLVLNEESLFAHRAHANLGYIYLKSDQVEKAFEHFRLAVGREPGNATYRNMLGILYGRQGLLDEAIAEFEAAVKLAPDGPAWRVNLDKARALRAKVSGENSQGGE